jgi:holo-[acyl-carrier protein] synthase
MRIHGIGIDVVEVERIAAALERHGKAFLARVFTADERAYCETRNRPAIHYAARFAAKEAAAKALGTGIGAHAGLQDLEVVHAAGGSPELRLAGPAREFATRHGITRILISLSHSHHHAAANAVAVCDD